MRGELVSINISPKKGERKKPVSKVSVKTDFGIENDAHASSSWHRQVSLLSLESIQKMQRLGLDVKPGDFAENLTTKGINLLDLAIGTKVMIGHEVEAEVSQIGKTCHNRCAIYYQAGDCVMPKEGIFIKILKGGVLEKGDLISSI